MADLKALREQIVDETSAKMEYDMQWQRDLIESALLQYAEACLGEPSEGMIERGNFSAASASPHDHTVRGMFNAMAAQRLKEIK